MLKTILALAVVRVVLGVVEPSALEEAVKALSEALTAGSLDPVLAIVAGVLVVGILVLKALGKSIPLVDPIVKGALDLVKRLRAPKAPPPEATPGASNVVDLEKLGK
jgi:cytochrome b561